MQELKKEITTQFKHIPSTGIKACQVFPNKNKVYASCMTKIKGGAMDGVYPVTPEMAKRIMKNSGSMHPQLKRGLTKTSRFEFILLVNEKGELAGTHLYPTKVYNEADSSTTINMNLDENEAVVQLHPNGEIEVFVMPLKLWSDTTNLIKQLEKVATIQLGDTFKTGTATYEAMRFNGSQMVIFSTNINE